MSLPPPASTRFPYTTLFRSQRHVEQTQVLRHAPGDEADADARVARRLELALDRKSTRLNSSHLVISYAVFCLKKKKNPHISNPIPFNRTASRPGHRGRMYHP